MDERKLARFLGWFSIGLGVTEIVAPGTITRLLGTKRKNDTLVRAYGVREIVSGVGILAQARQPAPWVWSRIGGDALDLATLGMTLRAGSSKPRNVGIAIAAVAGIAALDLVCSRLLSGASNGESQPQDYSHFEQRSGYQRERLGQVLA